MDHELIRLEEGINYTAAKTFISAHFWEQFWFVFLNTALFSGEALRCLKPFFMALLTRRLNIAPASGPVWQSDYSPSKDKNTFFVAAAYVVERRLTHQARNQ